MTLFTPSKLNYQLSSKFKSVLSFLLIGILTIFSSCNSASSDINDFDEKIKVSNEMSATEIAQQEMFQSISNLFDTNYNLQTKGRRVLLKKYLNHQDFAGELAKKAIVLLNKENNKFDQYNVVFLLSKASQESIFQGREVVRKYLMKIERKNYVGPKMAKNISMIKKKLN